MEFVATLLSWLFIALVVLAVSFTYLAGRNMAAAVADPFIEFNFRTGIFGDRSKFTERGWRYRNQARRLWIGAVCAMLVWFFA